MPELKLRAERCIGLAIRKRQKEGRIAKKGQAVSRQKRNAADGNIYSKVTDLTDTMVRENRLTTLMVTHNMNQALRYGNRMVMLHQGKVQLDIKGEDKQKLTVAEIVAEFGQTLKDETLLST